MEKVKKEPAFKILVEFITIAVGAILAAYALKAILVPNSILDGGVNGISIILNILFGWKLGLVVFIINLPFIYIGYKNLGRNFLFKVAYGILIFAIMLEVFENVKVLTDNILLATIYGSVLLGVGVGLIIRSGGCLDGTESLGIVISKHTSFSVGQFVLCCNIIIFTIAGYFFGIDRALFSLLAYFITSKVVDEIGEGFEKAKAALIITENGHKMAEHIYKTIGRTVTQIKGSGLISGEKAILYCVITRIEVSELKKVVREEDQSAFITISDVSEIIGSHIKSNKAKLK